MEIKLLEAENVILKPQYLVTTTLGKSTHDRATDTIFRNWEGAIITVILVVLCIFGLAANAITFCTIITSRVLRKSPFNILILSLSISDFLSALNSPLQMYRLIWGYLEYNLSVGSCKYTVGMIQLTMFVTVQHILVFALFRLLAILFPHKIKRFTAKWAKGVCVFIWIEVFLAYSLFYIIASTVVPYKPGRYKTACTAVASSWRPIGTRYVRVALPIMLFAPFVGILLCTIIITGSLIKMRWNRATSRRSGGAQDFRQEHENAALLQVTLIVFSFLFGYSIDAVYRMTKALDMRDLFTLRSKWLTVMISYVCLRFSECLNPVFYNLASSQMRESTRKFLRIQQDMPSTESSASAGSRKSKATETPI